jgi:hypothetical protein
MTRFDHDFLTALRVKPDDVTEPDSDDIPRSLVLAWSSIERLHVKVENRNAAIILMASVLVVLMAGFWIAWISGDVVIR